MLQSFEITTPLLCVPMLLGSDTLAHLTHQYQQLFKYYFHFAQRHKLMLIERNNCRRSLAAMAHFLALSVHNRFLLITVNSN